jgi:predicted aconitase with swiveling domain
LQKQFQLRVLIKGTAEGELLVYDKPISFLGEVDPKKGVIRTKEKELEIKDKILVFPYSRGSTVGSYVIYALKYYNNSPKAFIVKKAEPILITGCVLAGVPLAEIKNKTEWPKLKKYRKASLKDEILTIIE